MNKILTVVIPTYNMEKLLDKCLSSLIIDKEFMPMIEVLIINDGSKDRSSEIGHGYQEKYPQTFRVIDKENGNYGSCINVGLKEASGKYIKVLDADDSFNTVNFQAMVKTMLDIEVDMVITDFMTIDENGNTSKIVKRNLLSGKSLTINDAVGEFMRQPAVAMHATAYRTENLRAIKYHQTEGISYTDEEWMFLPVTTVKSLYYISEVVYLYLVGREGQTVDVNIVAKNWKHSYIGINNEIGELLNLPQNTNKKYIEYLETRLYYRISSLYYLLLVVSPSRDIPEELRALDERIKTQFPGMYKKLGEEKLNSKLPLRYVIGWRKRNGHKSEKCYLSIIHNVYSLARKVLR